jgi:hypothetical protein
MTDEPDGLSDESRDNIERFHQWLELALQYVDREGHDDLADLINEDPHIRGYPYLLVLQHKALLAERVQVEAQALDRLKQQEAFYLNELLKKGQQYQREKDKVHDLLHGADALPTTEDRSPWWRRVSQRLASRRSIR